MALNNFIQVVDDDTLTTIHDATMDVLWNTGVEFLNEEALAVFKTHGAVVEGSRVKFPSDMVEKAIETAPAAFTLYARDEARSILIGENQPRTHVEPSNGTIHAQCLEKGRRPALMADLVNFFKLAQAGDVCTINGGIPVEPTDVTGPDAYMDIFFQTLKHTDKPLRSTMYTRPQIETLFEMFEIAKGQKGYLREHPAIYASINPLSPLAFDQAPAEAIITYARHGQPTTVLSCSLAGVSAPMSLMGTVVMQNAEILSGLVLTQLVNPGVPFIYAPASSIPNMQTGGYVTGSPESNVINMTNIQLAREKYHLPTRTMAGLNDAKTLDCQAGFETMQNLFQCMMGGASIVNECLGVMDGIMTNSYEKFMMDEEMISRILRFMEGITGPNQDPAVEVIKAVGPRGSFLSHMSTMKLCRNAWRPTVSSWENYDRWQSDGAKDVAVAASEKYKKILADCPDSTLDDAAERDLAAFMAGRRSER